jgi:hypothetical protein
MALAISSSIGALLPLRLAFLVCAGWRAATASRQRSPCLLANSPGAMC